MTPRFGWPHPNAIWIPISDTLSVNFAYVPIAENHHAGPRETAISRLKNEDRYCPLIHPIGPGKHSASLDFRATEATSARALCVAATPRTKAISKPATRGRFIAEPVSENACVVPPPPS